MDQITKCILRSCIPYSIKDTLVKLYGRKGFHESCELWQKRHAVTDVYMMAVPDPGFLKGGAVHLSRGVWGRAPPLKILNFRPSEVVSGAFWVENCFLRLLYSYVHTQALVQLRLKECVSLYCVYAYACARMRINSVRS